MLDNQTRIAIIEERYSHMIADLDDIKNSLSTIEKFVNTYSDKIQFCDEKFTEKFILKKELNEKIRNKLEDMNDKRLLRLNNLSNVTANILDFLKVIMPVAAVLYAAFR